MLGAQTMSDFNTVDECDRAFDEVLRRILSYQVNGMEIYIPGSTGLLNIYEAAKRLSKQEEMINRTKGTPIGVSDGDLITVVC